MGIIMRYQRGDRREGHGRQGQIEDERDRGRNGGTGGGRDRGREGVTRRKVGTK